jgi:hypothetical protein
VPDRRGREGKMMDVVQYVDDNAAEFFGAPNEKVEMTMLLKGAEAAAYRWDELAAVADELPVGR